VSEEKPAPIIITPEPVTVRLSPLGFQMWATQFLQAARAVEETGSFSPVRYFLACRSIELALKAYLLARGHSPMSLKNSMGHDLCKALAKAQDESLADVVALTDAESEVVKSANSLYRSKRFEYFEVLDAVRGFPNRPDMVLLLHVAERLALGVHRTCMEA